jgi:asparagine synthase (glutamine-hydrolysing)
MSKEKVHAITVGYEDRNFKGDERLIAKRFCKERSIDWHEIVLSTKEFRNNLEEYISLLDEPNGDIASFSQWSIYKKSRELGFKVLLSGNGGDELFYGYPSHNKFASSLDYLARLKQFNLTNEKRLLKMLFYTFLNPKQSLILIKHFMTNGHEDISSLLKGCNDFGEKLEMMSYIQMGKNHQEQIYDFLFNIWLPNNCYFLADKLGMGNSVEVRSPFADHQLIEFTTSIPRVLNNSDSESKMFLRKCFKDMLPDYILNGPKRGFTPP